MRQISEKIKGNSQDTCLEKSVYLNVSTVSIVRNKKGMIFIVVSDDAFLGKSQRIWRQNVATESMNKTPNPHI